MASFLELVNDADLSPCHKKDHDVYNFHVSNIPPTIGFILPPLRESLRTLPNWEIDDTARTITLTSGNSSEERSNAIEKTLLALRETGNFEILEKWRNERFAVFGPNKEVLLTIERCASPLFGVVTYGVHALAYIERQEDPMRIWVPRRAYSKQTYGGMLDSSAAGGISATEGPLETIARECEEEAALPREFVLSRAVAVGMVTDFYVRGKCAGGETKLLQPECHYVYDLPLPRDVVCRNNDGEVEEFYLWTVEEVERALRNREFKPNSALVMLDFFIRHGIVTPENERDYVEIVARLHRKLPFPTR